MSKEILTFDPTYSGRYTARNKRKLSLIKERICKVESAIDIGCNEGYIIGSLLEAGLVKRGYGIELRRSVVDCSLLNRDNFTLYEQDLVEHEFVRCYDVVFYLAVHHHIFGKYGKQTALTIWREIVNHCNNSIYFETGEIAERGDFYWKDELKRYYSSDDSHIDELIRMVGPRFKGMEIIGFLPIHGTKRAIMKILLDKLTITNTVSQSYKKAIYGSYSLIDDMNNQWDILGTYKRNVGSKDQQLLSVEDIPEKVALNVFEGTIFYKLRNKVSGDLFFSKKIIDNPFKEIREFIILKSVNHPRIIKYIGVHEKFGIMFPVLDWKKYTEVDFKRIKNKKIFRSQIKQFFKYAKHKTVTFGEYDYNHHRKSTEHSLLSIIDIHPSNVLVKIEEEVITDWIIIDMEYYSNHNRWRNYMFKRQILSGNTKALVRLYYFTQRLILKIKRIFTRFSLR